MTSVGVKDSQKYFSTDMPIMKPSDTLLTTLYIEKTFCVTVKGMVTQERKTEKCKSMLIALLWYV